MTIKEFKHVLRDPRSLFFLLAQPVMLMLLFGFALSNEVKESRIAIIDQSGDEETKKLIDRLDQSEYFEVTGHFSDPSSVPSLFEKGAARLAIVFPPQFANDLKHLNAGQIQILADASDPNTAAIAASYAAAVFGAYQDELLGLMNLPYKINIETRMLYNPQLVSAFSFVPGVMTLILTILCTMMTSVAIVREKELGTLEVLLASPMHPMQIVVSKAVPYLVLALIDVAVILLLAVYVLGVPIRGSLFLLMAENTLYISNTLALGLLVSTITDKQQIAMFVSLVGFMLPALLFSGFMFPIENMPWPLQWFSHIVPTRWYYSIVKAIMIKGLGFASIWKETLILAVMTFGLLLIAVKKFKVRLL